MREVIFTFEEAAKIAAAVESDRTDSASNMEKCGNIIINLAYQRNFWKEVAFGCGFSMWVGVLSKTDFQALAWAALAAAVVYFIAASMTMLRWLKYQRIAPKISIDDKFRLAAVITR